MDLWGFDGRQREEIPGEEFLLLETPAAGPVGAVVRPTADGSGVAGIDASSGFTEAGRTLHSTYDGITGDLNAGGAAVPSNFTYESLSTPEGRTAFTNWWNRADNGGRAVFRGDASAMDRRINRFMELQGRYSTAKAEIEHPPSGRSTRQIQDGATSVMNDVNTEYRAGSGGGGGGGNGVGTASAGPGALAGLREGVRGATGLLADTAALGAAARTNQAIWGGGNGGSYGINVADGMGNTSAFGGPGGGFGGVGTAGYGGVGGFGGGMDLSNTGFGIGMQGGEARAKSRQLDAMINQLLAAIAMGNLDAITSALTMCNLKAKSTMSQAATHVVRAMQLYDRQMRTISDQMGSIAGQSGNNPNTGAQMGHLNAEMNQISMSRQAISNMLRDIMSMNEEMSNMEKSIYDVKSREASFYRWS